MYRLPDIVENGLPIVHIGKLIPMGKRSDRERSSFGQRMLEARERAGLTQKEACKALKIAQSTLSGLEGPDQSSSRTVEFARLYKCDPTWLATGEGSQGLADTAQAPPSQNELHRRLLVAFEACLATDQARFVSQIEARAGELREIGKRLVSENLLPTPPSGPRHPGQTELLNPNHSRSTKGVGKKGGHLT